MYVEILLFFLSVQEIGVSWFYSKTYNHRRRNQGGRGATAPQISKYMLLPPPPPPQISTPEINQHWLEIIFKHVL